MWRNRRLGAIVLVGGAVLLNFAYLGDLMLRKPGGIILGPWSGLTIVIANIAIVAALLMMFSQRPPPKEAGPGDRRKEQVETRRWEIGIAIAIAVALVAVVIAMVG